MIKNIITDKEPIYETDKYDVILIGMNTHRTFGGIWHKKLSIKYPQIIEEDAKTKYRDKSKIGTTVTVYGEDGQMPTICLMYICSLPNKLMCNVNYDAFEKCLKEANDEYKGKKVMMTVIGSSQFDGYGDKEKSLSIIEKNTPDLLVDIYDYPLIPYGFAVKKAKQYFSQLQKKHAGNKEKLADIALLKKQVLEAGYLNKK